MDEPTLFDVTPYIRPPRDNRKRTRNNRANVTGQGAFAKPCQHCKDMIPGNPKVAVCRPCFRARRCPVCGGRWSKHPSAKWCRECTTSISNFVRILSMLCKNEKGPRDYVADDRIMELQKRAEANLPLFE